MKSFQWTWQPKTQWNSHKESLTLFSCFRCLKQHLFGVFRGLKYGRTFLEFSGALNSQKYAISGAWKSTFMAFSGAWNSKSLFGVFRGLKVPQFGCLRRYKNWRKLKLIHYFERVFIIKSRGSLGPNIKYAVNKRQEKYFILKLYFVGNYFKKQKINLSRSFSHSAGILMKIQFGWVIII